MTQCSKSSQALHLPLPLLPTTTGAAAAMGAAANSHAYDSPEQVAAKLARRRPCVLAFLSPHCGLCSSLRPALDRVRACLGLCRCPRPLLLLPLAWTAALCSCSLRLPTTCR